MYLIAYDPAKTLRSITIPRPFASYNNAEARQGRPRLHPMSDSFCAGTVDWQTLLMSHDFCVVPLKVPCDAHQQTARQFPSSKKHVPHILSFRPQRPPSPRATLWGGAGPRVLRR